MANTKSKRFDANRIIRIKIAKALIKLMENKSFSEITITEIVNTAGIARTSYYRNFDSKEDILAKSTEDIFNDYRAASKKLNQEYYSYDNILLLFRYFKSFKKFILTVYRGGLASIYLEGLDHHIEELAGDMPFNDINRYSLYYYSGALYNVFLKWLENDMKESPEEIATAFYHLLTHGINFLST